MSENLDVLRRCWHPVAFVDDLAAGPVARRLLGTDLVLWLGPDGTPSAAVDRCPHREAALSGGWVDRGRLVCPYHGWQYDTAGRCVVIPQNSEGQRPNPRAVIAVHATKVALGMVWVTLSEDPLGTVPFLPEAEGLIGGWRVIREFDSPWDCAAPHLVDNNLDFAHPAFVHQQTFGSPDQAQVGVGAMERTGYGMVGRARIPVKARPGQDGATERLAAVHVTAPFTGFIHLTYPDGLQHVLVKAVTPVDDRTCRLLQISVRNDTEADLSAEAVIAFNAAVAVEDRLILDRMPAAFPTRIGDLVHVDTDRASIGYRRLLADLIAGTWVPDADGRIPLHTPDEAQLAGTHSVSTV